MLKLPHQVYEYLCPINGISDVYEWKTGKRIPDPLLFYLSSMGFSYIRQQRVAVPRMVFWTSGIGKRQYGFLEEVMGCHIQASEGTAFAHALKKAQQFIDSGTPVLLFGLDMYHLPYFDRFYHAIHIPGHIILMVGYADDQEVVYVHDNSRAGVQAVPYVDLKAAWNNGYPEGQAKKNALFAVSFRDQVPDACQIVSDGLRKRAALALRPGMRFLGVPGIRMLADDFANWEKALEVSAYTQALEHVVTFTGSIVPALPGSLAAFDNGIADNHQGARDRFATALLENQAEYGNLSWENAAMLFRKSGESIGLLTEILTAYLLRQQSSLEEVPKLLNQIADYEERAFTALAA